MPTRACKCAGLQIFGVAVQRSLTDEQWNTVIEGSSRCAAGEPMTEAGMLEAELQVSC